jgi:hypothetical protein
MAGGSAMKRKPEFLKVFLSTKPLTPFHQSIHLFNGRAEVFIRVQPKGAAMAGEVEVKTGGAQ